VIEELFPRIDATKGAGWIAGSSEAPEIALSIE
jgi:hypothetical protein